MNPYIFRTNIYYFQDKPKIIKIGSKGFGRVGCIIDNITLQMKIAILRASFQIG